MSNFDILYDRKSSGAIKWKYCTENEIPMWIADMDFPMPQPILDALHARLGHPFLGYDSSAKQALATVAEHYSRLYRFEFPTEWFTLVPSVMAGVQVACAAVGGSLIYCTPIYSHIRDVGPTLGQERIEVPMKVEDGRYLLDFDALEAAVTPETRCFLFCSPHNPVGRQFSRAEILQVLRFCERHGLTLISDEIHCEVILDELHTPAAALCHETTAPIIVVSSAAKICNVARSMLGFTIIPDQTLRERVIRASCGIFGMGGTLDGVILKTAYSRECDAWKMALRDYLRGNRDLLEARIAEMPHISVTHCESTFLAWIDCRALGVESPKAFFHEKAHLIFNDGSEFGAPGFVRMNYACPRPLLTEALNRMAAAVADTVPANM